MKVVAVTGLHRGENPQPGAAVIASLRRRFPKVRIVGLSYDPLESGLYGRGHDRPDAAYLLPFPGFGAKALWERLSEILDRERLDFMIPCLDSEIANFIDIEPKLRDRGIGCILPTKEALMQRSKSKLYDFCRDIDVYSPRTRVVYDLASLQEIADQIDYPVYVKGKFYEAHLVSWKQDLLEACGDISRVWGWPVLLQDVLVGEEYDVAGVGDGDGGIMQHCGIRKMLRSATGKGFAGIVVENPELDRISATIIKALRWNGPFELEFIKVPGRPHALFEINPRFPAWIDFPSQIGCNMPGLLLERLLGKKQTPLRDCTAGQMFIRHSVDIVGNLADLAEMARSGEHIDGKPLKDSEVGAASKDSEVGAASDERAATEKHSDAPVTV